MVSTMKEKTIEIIDLCQQTLLDKTTENVEVIKIILREFKEILISIDANDKIPVLNKNRDLWATRTMIDSADFNYDDELFSQIREFQKLCRKIEEKFIKVKFE